jgi:hypothetical protein
MSGDEDGSGDAPWQQIVQKRKLVPAAVGKPFFFSPFFSVLSFSLCSRQSSADDVKRYTKIEGKK